MTDIELIKKEIDELNQDIINAQNDIDSVNKSFNHFSALLSNRIIARKMLPENFVSKYNFIVNSMKECEAALHELKDKKIRKVCSLVKD